MKKIPWHNPAQQTPPKGYRLLIPEEVDGRFESHKLPTVKLWRNEAARWQCQVSQTRVAADSKTNTYAVPRDTPLPEGYTLIDGDVWQMNGWTAHTPNLNMDVIAEGTVMEVMLRNGEKVTGPRRQHWFGHLPSEPRAEIIGWRVVGEAPKPLMALDAEESEGLHISTDAIKTASAQLLGRIESFYRDLVDENQRLKNELADAQAMLKSIRSLLP